MLISMGNFGDLYTSQGRYDEAEMLFRPAVEGVRRSLPREHSIFGIIVRKYGRCLKGLMRFDEAEMALLEAHEFLTAALGAEHAQTLKVVRKLKKDRNLALNSGLICLNLQVFVG